MKEIQLYNTPLDNAVKLAAQKYNRIAITGWPNTGKTTSVNKLVSNHEIYHTDDYMGDGGFKRSWKSFVEFLNTKEKFIVEGVSVAQLIEQGLNTDIIFAVKRTPPPEKHHESMCKAIFTVLDRAGRDYTLIVNDILTIS